MIDPQNVPPVDDDELLARFIVSSGDVKANGAVNYRLFMPYSRVELSVNRHRDATIEETWAFGMTVAEQRGKTLLGRADIRASACRIPPLKVVESPIEPNESLNRPHNPNHADIVGFPPDKPDQKSLAAKLAASIEDNWIRLPESHESGL